MSLELPYGIKRLDASSDADEMFGYYLSLEEACTAVAPGLRKGGRRVGIKQPDGKIQIYWWENDNDLSDDGLVPFATGGGQGGNYFKEIIKDGDFTAEKIVGGADDGKYQFKIKGDKILKWKIGGDESEYLLDANDEWKHIADALGAGVERRIDAVSYGKDGDIHYFKGTEIGQAVYPNVPEEDILKTFITITENGILVENNDYITKQSENWVRHSVRGGTLDVNIIHINGLVRNRTADLTGTIDDVIVKGFIENHPSNNPVGQIIPCWNGMEAKIHNDTGKDLILLHNDTYVTALGKFCPFMFPDGQTFRVKPNEIITFKRRNITSSKSVYLFAYISRVPGGSSGALTKIANWTEGMLVNKEEVVVHVDYDGIQTIFKSLVDNNDTEPNPYIEVDESFFDNYEWQEYEHYLETQEEYVALNFTIEEDVPIGRTLIKLKEPYEMFSWIPGVMITHLFFDSEIVIPAGQNLYDYFNTQNGREVVSGVTEENYSDFLSALEIISCEDFISNDKHWFNIEGFPFRQISCPFVAVSPKWEIVSNYIGSDYINSRIEDYLRYGLIWSNETIYSQVGPDRVQIQDMASGYLVAMDFQGFTVEKGDVNAVYKEDKILVTDGSSPSTHIVFLPKKSGTLALSEDIFIDNYSLDAKETLATWKGTKKIMKITFEGVTASDGRFDIDISSFGITEGELIQIEGVYDEFDGNRSVNCNYMRHIDFDNSISEVTQCYLDKVSKTITGSWVHISERTMTPVRFKYRVTLKYALP